MPYRLFLGAVRESRRQATYVTASHEDEGFARAIEQLILPLAVPALSSGLVLCWARAVGEFGATMMFAGNFMGRTQTMPLAIMGAMESDLYAALALSVLLIALAFGVLFLYRLIGGRRGIEL